MSQRTFSFQSNFYKISDGLAIGCPLSPILGDIYIHYLERTLFNTLFFRFCTGYVDDTLNLINITLDNIVNIMNIMNSIDSNVQITLET